MACNNCGGLGKVFKGERWTLCPCVEFRPKIKKATPKPKDVAEIIKFPKAPREKRPSK